MPVVLDDSTAAIGAIQSAFLTETQFQGQFGTGWILADGRSVTGSRYASLTGSASVPDLRGVVLRGKNNGRNDGKENPSFQFTGLIALNSKNITFTTTGLSLEEVQVGQLISGTNIPDGARVESVSHSGDVITVVMSATASAAGSRQITFSGDLNLGSYQADQYKKHQHGYGSDDQAGGGAGHARLRNFGYDATSSMGGGGGVFRTEDNRSDPTLGGAENRMKNVTVNHFIRIN